MMEDLLFATKDKTTAAQQRTKRAIKPKEYAPTGGPPGTYQADIIFFEELARANRGYKSILTAISANSRFAYAQPLKKKGDATEAMVTIKSSQVKYRLLHGRLERLGRPQLTQPQLRPIT